jgi:hypothetical protein
MSPSEDRSELVNHVRDELRELGQRYKNRFTLDNRRFAYRYLYEGLHLILATQGPLVQHVAVLDRDWGRPLVYEGHGRELDPSEFFADRDSTESQRGDDGQPVLVHNVEIMKGTQRFVCPSLVRFHRKDEVFKILGGSLYLSSRSGFILSPGRSPVSHDWECGRSANLVSVIRDSETDEMIESGSEVVNDVTNPQGDLVGDVSADLGDLLEAIWLLRVGLDDDFIWLGTQEPTDLNVKLMEVIVGPLDLVVNARQALSRHESERYADNGVMA